MSEYKSDVTFSSNAPIDVNALNDLKRNIDYVYRQNDKQINVINTTVGDLSKQIKVVPVVDSGRTADIQVKKGQVSLPISFNNPNFSDTPILVASMSTNLKNGSQITIWARATSRTGGTVELISTNDVEQTVKVNWIAIQLQEIK